MDRKRRNVWQNFFFQGIDLADRSNTLQYTKPIPTWLPVFPNTGIYRERGNSKYRQILQPSFYTPFPPPPSPTYLLLWPPMPNFLYSLPVSQNRPQTMVFFILVWKIVKALLACLHWGGVALAEGKSKAQHRESKHSIFINLSTSFIFSAK